jgi:hypothetical protein
LLPCFFQGCTDNEASARKLYNEALTLQQNGDKEKTNDIYKEIVAKYPETETAVEVNKILTSTIAIKGITNAINQNTDLIRQETQTLQIQADKVQQEDIAATLDMFKLDLGRYPSTEEGLQALIAKPDTMIRWNGPYLTQENTDFINDYIYINDGSSSKYSLLKHK